MKTVKRAAVPGEKILITNTIRLLSTRKGSVYTVSSLLGEKVVNVEEIPFSVLIDEYEVIISGDEKYCSHCETFFPLENGDVIAWHNNAACRRRIDVSLDWLPIDGYPGREQKFKDVQRDRDIPAKALEGYRVHEIYRGSGGQLIATYIKD